jgi:phenylacetate-coenzyme A ligase PaaK-like adenylate-forming protein
MATDNLQTQMEMMKAVVDQWHQAVANPARAQEIRLEELLKIYSQTDYGRKHNCEKVGSYSDFKKAFPVQTYNDFKPYIDKVMAGNTHALLSEEPIYIATTKGTTGKPKMFPFTPTLAKESREFSLRCFFSYSLLKHNFEWMAGYRLNLVPSSNVGTIKVGDREMMYGFTTAVQQKMQNEYSKAALKVIPTLDEMNALPSEPSKENWELRYELAYQKARETKITHILTNPTVTVGFGRYLLRKHHISPKDIWQVQYIMSGAFTGTHTRFAPVMHTLYGKSVDIRESYGATEGAFGSQIDDRKAWTPMYDRVFFEVQTINGIKPMHEMYPGEIGSLIVSNSTLPRYRIGDLILAYQAPYFCCIGRENTKLHPYHFGKLTGKSAFNLTEPDLPSFR